MTPKQEISTSILTAWSLIAARGGTDQAIAEEVAKVDVDVTRTLAAQGGDPQDVARAAGVLTDGLRREALATCHHLRSRAETEGLSPAMTRLAMHDELRVQNLSAITARHLIMVAKVNDNHDPRSVQRAMVTRLAVARANGIAAVALRQAVRSFA